MLRYPRSIDFEAIKSWNLVLVQMLSNFCKCTTNQTLQCWSRVTFTERISYCHLFISLSLSLSLCSAGLIEKQVPNEMAWTSLDARPFARDTKQPRCRETGLWTIDIWKVFSVAHWKFSDETLFSMQTQTLSVGFIWSLCVKNSTACCGIVTAFLSAQCKKPVWDNKRFLMQNWWCPECHQGIEFMKQWVCFVQGFCYTWCVSASNREGNSLWSELYVFVCIESLPSKNISHYPHDCVAVTDTQNSSLPRTLRSASLNIARISFSTINWTLPRFHCLDRQELEKCTCLKENVKRNNLLTLPSCCTCGFLVKCLTGISKVNEMGGGVFLFAHTEPQLSTKRYLAHTDFSIWAPRCGTFAQDEVGLRCWNFLWKMLCVCRDYVGPSLRPSTSEEKTEWVPGLRRDRHGQRYCCGIFTLCLFTMRTVSRFCELPLCGGPQESLAHHGAWYPRQSAFHTGKV